MTDDPTPKPGTPEANDLIVRGCDGDPLPDPRGTRMIERESYERVVDGLRLAAEGCAHLALHSGRLAETASQAGAEEQRQRFFREATQYAGIARRLDQCRSIAVEYAGDELPMRQRETQAVRGQPLKFMEAKRRLRDGLTQAAGGMRQLASCFRGDLRWSAMARSIENLQLRLKGRSSSLLQPANRARLVMPEHGTRQ